MVRVTTGRISQIQLVVIPVNDQDRSLAFYEALGFERRNDTPWGDGYRWVGVCIRRTLGRASRWYRPDLAKRPRCERNHPEHR